MNLHRNSCLRRLDGSQIWVKLSETPGRITRPPLVGEHTDEVLIAHGFTHDEVAHLREIKAIR